MSDDVVITDRRLDRNCYFISFLLKYLSHETRLDASPTEACNDAVSNAPAACRHHELVVLGCQARDIAARRRMCREHALPAWPSCQKHAPRGAVHPTPVPSAARAVGRDPALDARPDRAHRRTVAARSAPASPDRLAVGTASGGAFARARGQLLGTHLARPQPARRPGGGSDGRRHDRGGLAGRAGKLVGRRTAGPEIRRFVGRPRRTRGP